MAQYTPAATIKLYHVDDIDTHNGRTMAFPNMASREAYMDAHIYPSANAGTILNCKVVKKRYQTIRITMDKNLAGGYDIGQYWNYLSFVNPNYGNKLYYARITNREYINSDVVEISYKIDWFLTDQFAAHYEPCSIVREGLTEGEHDLLQTNPYNYGIIKMRTPEALNTSEDTEELRYKVAATNVMSTPIQGQTGNAWHTYDGWEMMTQQCSVYKDGNSYKWSGGVAIDNSTPDSAPFYIICFPDNASGLQLGLKVNVYHEIYNYAGGTHPFLFCASPFSVSGDDPISFTYYGQARHREGAGQSTSISPLKDTRNARPYCMVGCNDIDTIQKCLMHFEDMDAVSSIINIYAIPTYLLDEFIALAFSNPALDLVKTNLEKVRMPFPNVAKRIKNNPNDDVDVDIDNYSPKLYWFPFSYAVIEATDGSGHVELKYEKMGPDQSTGYYQDDLGQPAVDEYGQPSFYCIRKFVSITADGVYVGVAPIDYENRCDSHATYHGDSQHTGESEQYTASDLDYAVFICSWPVAPYTTDAYFEWLGSQAKSLIMSNTFQNEDARIRTANTDYRDIASQQVGNVVGLAGNSAATLGNVTSGNFLGAGASASTVGTSYMNMMNTDVVEQNFHRARGITEGVIGGAYDYMNNPRSVNDFTSNFATCRQAFVTPNWHAGSTSGALNMVRYVEPAGVNIIMKKRSTVHENAYTNYFKMYGYADLEFKLPSIVELVTGGDTPSRYPHFEKLLGSAPDATKMFYTKTENMHVTGVCAESANFIESLFNGGAQFIYSGYNPS